MVTVAVYGHRHDEDLARTIASIRGQLQVEVTVVESDRREDEATFINRIIEESPCRYLLFLREGTVFGSERTLVLMTLAAEADDANVLCGHRSDKGRVEYNGAYGIPGLSSGIDGVLFNAEWLRSLSVRAEGLGPYTEAGFLLKTVACMGNEAFFRQTTDRIGKSAFGDFTSTECRQFRLLFYACLARFAKEKGFARLKAWVLGELEADGILPDAQRFYFAQSDDDRERLRQSFICELASALEMPGIEGRVSNPLVSVIVPAYNVAPYLPRTLDSLLRQTLAALEIIVVDDGSRDETAQICDAYAAEHRQIRVVHQENAGPSASRNAGLALAKGRYVGFVDGDDYVDSQMFEKMSDLLECHPEAAFAMCGVKVEFLYDVSESDKKWAQKYFDFAEEGAISLTPSVVGKVNCVACNKLYRREFLDSQKIRFPLGFKNEDAVFSFFVFGKARAFVATHEPFYHYMRNDKGIMATQVTAFQSSSEVPDAISRAMPLIAEYLVRDDRRDLLGAFFKRLCGAANGFPSDEVAKRVARILCRTDYFFNREFLNTEDLGWCRNQLSRYANYDFSDLPADKIDLTMLPVLRTPQKRNDQPLVSFVIPVCNQELYVNYCLESVRKQTLPDIEIICIDDGSTDRSAALVEKLAAIDGRIRLLRQENRGAGLTRNRGLQEAHGKYVIFVDADDYVERNYGQEVVERMESDSLDMCIIDLDCFDYRTRAKQGHYWSLHKQKPSYPPSRVFSFADLKQYRCMIGPCAAIWRRQFLIDNGVAFPEIANGEDFVFWMRAIPFARRIGLIDRTFYHYRRGNPNSAVSRLHSEVGEKRAVDACRAFVDNWSSLKSRLDLTAKELLAGRLVIEMVYHARLFSKVLAYLKEEGFVRLGFGLLPEIKGNSEDYKAYLDLQSREVESESAKAVSYRDGFPVHVRNAIEKIERARAQTAHDLYLVTGQLNSTSDMPIDSWTFFHWLQDHQVPSRYVLWEKSEAYESLKRRGLLKDVIALKGNGVDDCEFILKCRDILPRCKVVGQENGALNWRVRKWLYYLEDCQYAYLEHGIKYWKYTNKLGSYLCSFNVINNTSQFEADLLLRDLPGYVDNGIKPKCIVGGLARLDTLRDERQKRLERDGFTVFVMFTWRSTFNAGQEALEKSAYYRGLNALFSEENAARLAKCGISLKVAAHHHLANHIGNLSLGKNIDIVPQSEIAYWKGYADACLTDYSSIMFDYLYLGKPVILWTPDRCDATLNGDDYNELVEVEHRAKNVPNVCHDIAEVISLMTSYADRGFRLEDDKRDLAKRFFAHCSEQCRHLYEALERVVEEERKNAPSAAV